MDGEREGWRGSEEGRERETARARALAFGQFCILQLCHLLTSHQKHSLTDPNPNLPTRARVGGHKEPSHEYIYPTHFLAGPSPIHLHHPPTHTCFISARPMDAIDFVWLSALSISDECSLPPAFDLPACIAMASCIVLAFPGRFAFSFL
jgi:hypothetical protein